MSIELRPIGRVVQGYASREKAPKQGRERDGKGRLIIDPEYLPGLEGLAVGSWIWLLLWFDRAERGKLKIHPRGDVTRPLTGVFNSRSPARPNPIALDLVRITALSGSELEVEGLDALTGTPILDIKSHMRNFDRIPGD